MKEKTAKQISLIFTISNSHFEEKEKRLKVMLNVCINILHAARGWIISKKRKEKGMGNEERSKQMNVLCARNSRSH